jgi:hypothetical protein
VPVDVVIVTFNSAPTLAPALASVRACANVARTVVVDNASTDDTLTIAAGFPGVSCLRNDANLGFARAVDRGLEQVTAELVLLLNPDAVLMPAALDLLRAAMRSDPSVGIAGALLIEDGTVCLGARRFSTPFNRLVPAFPLLHRFDRLGADYDAHGLLAAGTEVVDVDYVWGAAMLIRRELLRRCDGLDRRFFMYSEDEDLSRSARMLGYRTVLVPGARAAHVGGASSIGREHVADARKAVANQLLFAKWCGRSSAAIYEVGMRLAFRAQAFVADRRGRATDAERARRAGRLHARTLASLKGRRRDSPKARRP